MRVRGKEPAASHPENHTRAHGDSRPLPAIPYLRDTLGNEAQWPMRGEVYWLPCAGVEASELHYIFKRGMRVQFLPLNLLKYPSFSSSASKLSSIYLSTFLSTFASGLRWARRSMAMRMPSCDTRGGNENVAAKYL